MPCGDSSSQPPAAGRPEWAHPRTRSGPPTASSAVTSETRIDATIATDPNTLQQPDGVTSE
eukprot:4108600-Pyramimonas_sp.AAC.1